MRKFRITVNGTTYEVEVEEIREEGGASPSPAAAPRPATPAQAPKPVAPKAAPKPATPPPAGASTVTAPMPGTILDIKVKEGDSVKAGEVLMILEAMKMENEIMAPADGTVATINVSVGASVNAGDVLLSLK